MYALHKGEPLCFRGEESRKVSCMGNESSQWKAVCKQVTLFNYYFEDYENY